VDEERSYFEYLRQRSYLAYLYRFRYLYPLIDRDLKGCVLDYGCGIGDFLRYRPNTIGVDVNFFNVAYCRSIGKIAVQIGTDGALPFAHGTFFAAVMDNVLEHIRADRAGAVIEELRRVIAPEGRLVIGVPGKKGFDADPDHKAHYSELALNQLTGRYGFVPHRSFRAPFASRFLDRHMAGYCMYAVFRRDSRTVAQIREKT
jgi:SAM-dependent methyltransferase